MRIKLARDTQRRLCRKQYIEVKTSFVTAEGPAVGTVWFDKELPEDEPKIVEEVNPHVRRVFFSDDRPCEFITTFIDYVQRGRYVLIGVVPAPASYTVT